MFSPKPETYLGDPSLKSLLIEIGSSLSVYEMKAIMLGAIHNPDNIHPNKLFEYISENIEVNPITFKDEDQAKRFFGQFFSCWNDMLAMKTAPNIFSSIPSKRTVESITDALEQRWEELFNFLLFLDANEYIDDFKNEKNVDAYFDLENIQIELEELLEEGPEDDDIFINEAITCLLKLEKQWEYSYPLIVEEFNPIRMKKITESNTHTSRSNLDPMQPSKNGPCPCGSGKKYKRCCEATHNLF